MVRWALFGLALLASACATRPANITGTPANVSGTWVGTWAVNMSSGDAFLELQQRGADVEGTVRVTGNVTGSATGPQWPVTGRVEGAELTLRNGVTQGITDYVVDGDRMTGRQRGGLGTSIRLQRQR